MITYISDKVSSFFIRHEIIQEKDRNIYDYCFEVCISFTINFIIVILLSIATRTFTYAICYILAFLPLRIIAGGYHANTHFRCMMTLIFSYLLFVCLIYTFPLQYIKETGIGIIMFSVSIIFVLATSEDKNNLLRPEKKVKLKHLSRIIGVLYAIVSSSGLILLKTPFISFSFILGFLTVALSLVFNNIKSRLAKI